MGFCVRPNRYALALATGSAVGADVFALHECDNPVCVKVSGPEALCEHVVAGTQFDNMRRMARARRGVLIPRAASGHNHRRDDECVGTAIGGDCTDGLIYRVDAAGVAVVVAATIEQERRAHDAVADLGGARRHRGAGRRVAAVLASIPVVGGDDGRLGELGDSGADAAHRGGRQRLGAIADPFAQIAPVDGHGGRADERLDDGMPARAVWAPVQVLLAVLSDAAAIESLPGLHGAVDLIALWAPGQRARPDVGHRQAQCSEQSGYSSGRPIDNGVADDEVSRGTNRGTQ
jgi:hypothetical protein